MFLVKGSGAVCHPSPQRPWHMMVSLDEPGDYSSQQTLSSLSNWPYLKLLGGNTIASQQPIRGSTQEHNKYFLNQSFPLGDASSSADIYMIFQFERYFCELYGNKVYYFVFLIRKVICIHYSIFEKYKHSKVRPCVLPTFSLIHHQHLAM